MYKLTEAADLEKAGRSLGAFFAAQTAEIQKTYDFHKAVALHHDGLKAHHDAMHKAHADHGAAHKAHADGLDAGDAHKAFHLGAASSHAGMADCHKAAAGHHDAIGAAHHAHADALKAQLDSLKALSGDFGGIKADGATAATPIDITALAKGEGSLDARVAKLSEALVAKAFEALNTNPAIGEKIQEIVLSQVEKAVGSKLVPTDVHRVAPDRPGLAGTLIPRFGAAPITKVNVPIQFEKMFSVDELQGATE